MDTSNNIFSTDISFDTKELTQQEMIDEIMPKLKDLLKRHFPSNVSKQRIKVYKDRISFAAPCCGDSASDNSKKRGNIILTGKYKNYYKCFNCGAFMPVTSFFSKYGEDLSLDLIDYFAKNRTDVSAGSDGKGVRLIHDTSEINRYAIDREKFKRDFLLEETSAKNFAHEYLVNRRQYGFENFLYSPKSNILFLLNLTDEGKILGMQIHHFDKEYRGPKYKTYNLSKIYSTMYKNFDIPIDDRVNQLSMIFNILRVDCSKPVNVFEGPMDSFLMKNSIALCGASKHVDFGFHARYMFDDDETGRKHAIDALNSGGEVFLWERLKSALGLPKKRKWDLNDVVIWCNNNNKQLPRLDDFFSSDSFDLMDL